jgi:hypothetical protein
MPSIIVKQPFKFAHHGHQVEDFAPSAQPRETSDECAKLAVQEGWAVLADAAAHVQAPAPATARGNRSRGAAPETTANPGAPETAAQ